MMWEYALQSTWDKISEALKKQKQKLLLLIAASALAGAAYTYSIKEEPRYDDSLYQEQTYQANQPEQNRAIEHVVSKGERCENIVKEYAQKHPEAFSYEVNTPSAIRRAINETVERTIQARPEQEYLRIDNVSAGGVKKPDGVPCDVMYAGKTTLHFEIPAQEKKLEQIISEQSFNEANDHETSENKKFPYALALAGASLAAIALRNGNSKEPNKVSREEFTADAYQKQQESRHYKKTQRTNYVQKRNDLAKDMRRAGVSVSDIAQTLGVSKSTVYRIYN